jgi:hypothetical protein
MKVFLLTALLAASGLSQRQLSPMEQEAVRELARAGLLGQGMEFLIDDKIPAGLIPQVTQDEIVYDDDIYEYYYDESEIIEEEEFTDTADDRTGAEDRGGPRRRPHPLLRRKRPLRPPKAKDILLNLNKGSNKRFGPRPPRASQPSYNKPRPQPQYKPKPKPHYKPKPKYKPQPPRYKPQLSYHRPAQKPKPTAKPAAEEIDSYGKPHAAPIDNTKEEAKPLPPVEEVETYGSPAADPVSVEEPDSYGSPEAPPASSVEEDSYGSPAADPVGFSGKHSKRRSL